MKKLSLLASLNLKADGSPRRFSILAYSGGKLAVDGFDLPVIVDLAGLTIPASVPILIDHTKSVEATLGLTDAITNDGKTLLMAGPVTGQSAMSQQVLAQAAAGHQWQASIGAMVGDTVEIPPGQSVTVNGQAFTGPVIVARQSVLRETSVLPMGADPTTIVNLAASAASLKGNSAMNFEQWCAQLGVDPAKLDETKKAAFMLVYETDQNPPATPPAPPVAATAPVAAPVAAQPAAPTAAAGAALNLTASLTQQNQALAANMRRVAEIQAKAGGFPLIAAKAIEENWSVDKVELEVLKASATKVRPTSFHSADKALPAGKVLEAAICMSRKTANHEKEFTAAELQAAHTQYRGQIGLKQLFLTAAMSNGWHGDVAAGLNRGNVGEVLRFAMTRQPIELQAAGAFSTLSLPGILSNVANKEILTGYMQEDDAWREVAAIKSVSDFKAVTSYRMLDDVEYEELGAGGEIKHGTLGEESYTRQAKTYAKMFSLTRTSIINDDLSAFDDLRNRIGKGSAKKLTKVFWTAFVNNSTFYTSARTNYISGGTSNLATDGVGLGLGVTAFRKMTSPSADGLKRVGAGQRPEILLVPPELEFIADALNKNANLGQVATSSANVFAGKYRPVVAWQLSDSGYTGYSTTAWYLLTGDKSMAPITVSFLNGVETPTVDEEASEFSTLGVQFRGYHDFGCDMAEYLGSLKSKGAA